jgi:hypothetical protein
MRNSFLEKKLIKKSAVGSVFCGLLMLVSIAGAVNISQKNANEIETLSYDFLFKSPSLKAISVNNNDFTLLELDGCLSMGETGGMPMLPVKAVTLLIPALKSVKNVYVTGTPVELDLNNHNLIEKPVFPYQNPVPFGMQPEAFKIDSNAYSVNAKYPASLKSDYSIGYSRGYAILDISLNPVQYNPVQGKVYYYPEMTLNIELEDSDYVNPFYKNNPEHRQWVEKLVLNHDVLDTYTSDLPTFDYPGGLCDPSDHYDYVIITTTYNSLNYWDTGGSLTYNWQSLMDKHLADNGLSCTLVTIQEINACTDYHSSNPLFNDQQAHIREFCKDAYQDWGTSYVLIGADGESNYIPSRKMKTAYESNIDADIYWSNLDLNFNADEDNYWGEEGDAGFDLYAELFIGRVTCDVPQDVSNWLTKVFYYADSMEDLYLDNAAFYGGDTGWQCQGDDFMDYSAIKGTDDWLGPNPGYDGPFPTWAGFQFGFETWNQENEGNEFDISIRWTAEPPNPGWQGGSTSAAINGLKTAINNNQVTLLSGIAHANPSMSLDVSASAWESQYTNTKPFFIHDYGCHCGDFDATDDGVLHSMLFHSNTELAFGCVYNTCYGWGNLYCTNSSSAFQAKEFWSYFLDLENKSGDFGNWQLGKAQAYSKDRMAPTINWDYSYGTWRAIIQGCLLFGDPAQTLKTPHPSDPPEKPSTPSGPSQGIWHVEYTYTSSSTDPDGDDITYIFNWGDGTSDIVGPQTSGQTAVAAHAWTEIGTYSVTVRAKDSWGASSPLSDPLVVTITDNTPPNNPTIDGPTKIRPQKEYLFTISTTDPDDHDIYLSIDWGDGNGAVGLGPYSSGQEVPFKHSWSFKGTYTIKVRATDTAGGESDWTTLDISVSLSRFRSLNYQILLEFLQKFPNAFPILRYILAI